MSYTHPGMEPAQTLDNKIKEYEVERHALFFTDPDARRIYKENIKFTVLRRNSINGRTYKDDPTIFSWGLLNEPRCETWKARSPPQPVCRHSQRGSGFDRRCEFLLHGLEALCMASKPALEQSC